MKMPINHFCGKKRSEHVVLSRKIISELSTTINTNLNPLNIFIRHVMYMQTEMKLQIRTARYQNGKIIFFTLESIHVQTSNDKQFISGHFHTLFLRERKG